MLPKTLELLEEFRSKPESYWLEAGAPIAHAVFQEAAVNVPAYAKFLDTEGIDTATIHSADDLKAVTPTTKKNYYDAYPFAELLLNGTLSGSYLICTSSGSSGKPHYWPRLKDQDVLDPALTELMYLELGVHEKKTLYISCLAMGTWVACNMMIDNTIEIARQQGLELSLITPGANNKQIIDIVKDIGDNFDQILLIGYPPTIRNVLVEGIEHGIVWKKYNPKIIAGGESVSQHWKDYILEKIGSTRQMDIGVVFGMAEMHYVSFETPIASYIRKALIAHPKVSRKLFSTTNVGALQQYNPTHRWIEEGEGELLITTRAGVPLVRYNSHDLGGVFGYSEMISLLKKEGIDISAILEQEGYSEEDIWKWPFFFCNGRGDSVSLMGANIYPENIEKFFYQHHTINDYKLAVHHSAEEVAQLYVYLELRANQRLSATEENDLITTAQQDIFDLLMEHNDDYADAYSEEPIAMMPKLVICTFREGPFAHLQMKQNHIVR